MHHVGARYPFCQSVKDCVQLSIDLDSIVNVSDILIFFSRRMPNNHIRLPRRSQKDLMKAAVVRGLFANLYKRE